MACTHDESASRLTAEVTAIDNAPMGSAELAASVSLIARQLGVAVLDSYLNLMVRKFEL